MKKILIIDIDQSSRSLYACHIANTLIKINQWLKITFITEKNNEAINALNLFEDVHLIEAEKFTESLKKLSLEASEKEVREFLSPVINTQWDYVLNLSRHPLGAIFTAFLKFEEVLGAYIKDRIDDSNFSNFYSYLLSHHPFEASLPLHTCQLYYGILDHFDELKPVELLWDQTDANQLKTKFEELKAWNKKDKVILLDCAIKEQNELTSFNYLINLYKKIFEETQYLPVLFSSDATQDSFVINRLRDLLKGEIYIVTVDRLGMTSFFENADLIITKNVETKTVADIVLKQTILLIDKVNLPTSDYGYTESSHVIHLKEYNDELTDTTQRVIARILGQSSVPIPTNDQIGVYKTTKYKTSTSLTPVNLNGTEYLPLDYLRSILYSRYIQFLLKIELPMQTISCQKYTELLHHERGHIKTSFNKLLMEMKNESNASTLSIDKIQRMQSEYSILAIGIMFATFNLGKSINSSAKFLEQMKPLIVDMLEFLSREEETPSQTVVLD